MCMRAVFYFLIRVLEACFAIGAIGCVLVLVLTTIDDVRELFGGEKEKKISE
jgi:hypothetical protein